MRRVASEAVGIGGHGEGGISSLPHNKGIIVWSQAGPFVGLLTGS